MEKKVIDLTKEKGVVTINYLHGKVTIDTEIGCVTHATQLKSEPDDPFDLVPKSIEEAKEVVANRNGKNVWSKAVSQEEAQAFTALMELRFIWHEWTKIFGTPDIKNHTVSNIRYDAVNEKFEVMAEDYCLSPLSFVSTEHADKFIECFGELLENAKILL